MSPTIFEQKNCRVRLGRVDGCPHFHINLVIDVSPYCDCYGRNDIPIVPDVGMFASFDPVALDQACADAVNKQPVVAGSLLAKSSRFHGDHFTDLSPETNWQVAIDHAGEIGARAERIRDYYSITFLPIVQLTNPWPPLRKGKVGCSVL